jgi:hypothetical protein
VNIVFFVLGDSQAPEFSVPTFRNTPFHLHIFLTTYEDGTGCSATSAQKIQTPGIHPKENIQEELCWNALPV